MLRLLAVLRRAWPLLQQPKKRASVAAGAQLRRHFADHACGAKRNTSAKPAAQLQRKQCAALTRNRKQAKRTHRAAAEAACRRARRA